MSPRRRRHELALLILFLIVALLVGFWFGRMSAPDSRIAFEKGRAAGQQLERQKSEQNRIETNILSEEVAAARSRSAASEPNAAASADGEPAPAGGGAGANNR
jgi:cell division protein FtsB